ncbi:uncharacterized protein LOC108053665 isoform X2 [Drosophila rhopaloa]|uniref:Uncharacterized protein LOC108053665 isoform X2 n=1 Tax=Drosophila rhopaloa TaxID=1041015 RepID=A0A6P4FQ60_DRORH|nr:uncharacterized protein LOC108053665 isoform X2 [Drosophila rhopaloa]
MKTSWSFNCGVLLLCSILCSGQNVTKKNDSQEVIRVKVMLQPSSSDSSSSSSSTTSTTTPKPNNPPTAKSSMQAHEIEEEDYNFHNDRLPALSEDEYNNLGEDANPLHFLKQQPLHLENEESQQQPSQQIKTQPDSPVVSPQPVGSPIYITIPIYISTRGKLPLTLTIGDQELSLKKPNGTGSGKKNPSTKAPNSHFNRLLQQIESPKRRTTNRHRSQLKSHIYAMKERMDRQDLVYHPVE